MKKLLTSCIVYALCIIYIYCIVYLSTVPLTSHHFPSLQRRPSCIVDIKFTNSSVELFIALMKYTRHLYFLFKSEFCYISQSSVL